MKRWLKSWALAICTLLTAVITALFMPVLLSYIPAWLFLLAFLPLSAFAMFAVIDAVIAAASRKSVSCPECVKCRYNLTGNTSGVCPECGSATTHRSLTRES